MSEKEYENAKSFMNVKGALKSLCQSSRKYKDGIDNKSGWSKLFSFGLGYFAGDSICKSSHNTGFDKSDAILYTIVGIPTVFSFYMMRKNKKSLEQEDADLEKTLESSKEVFNNSKYD